MQSSAQSVAEHHFDCIFLPHIKNYYAYVRMMSSSNHVLDISSPPVAKCSPRVWIWGQRHLPDPSDLRYQIPSASKKTKLYLRSSNLMHKPHYTNSDGVWLPSRPTFRLWQMGLSSSQLEREILLARLLAPSVAAWTSRYWKRVHMRWGIGGCICVEK